MTKSITNTLKVLLLATALSFGLAYVYAWAPPSATPPTGNVSAPINTSATPQTKAGNINITAGSAYKYNGFPVVIGGEGHNYFFGGGRKFYDYWD